MNQTKYGFGAEVQMPYDEAVGRTKELLQAEGFGMLTEIDVQKTMKQKLNVEFRKYVILGACNPHLAHRAFEAELEIGLLLPCNVAVYEDAGGSVVSIMDPLAVLGVVGNERLRPVTEEARARLERVVRKLSQRVKV
ncbi:MAG TPA: DUF302 domain-containing protein [bacterium]|nr:DUF302 domain-containing protein [bacterium]